MERTRNADTTTNPRVDPPTEAQRLAIRQRPNRSPLMYQSWNQLLFLHWRIDPDLLQQRLPRGLYVDCYQGDAYLGVVPFYMRNIRFRGTPAIPWISNFLELNVRTYVHDGAGNAGVWFFSLDCNQPLAVWTAQTLFHLPYEHAKIQADVLQDLSIDYRSRRSKSHPTNNGCRFRYRIDAQVTFAQPGTLEFFLAERYLLFASDSHGRISRGQVFHTPYPLSQAKVQAWDCDLFEWNDFRGLSGRGFDHAMGSRGVDVEVFALQRSPPESS